MQRHKRKRKKYTVVDAIRSRIGRIYFVVDRTHLWVLPNKMSLGLPRWHRTDSSGMQKNLSPNIPTLCIIITLIIVHIIMKTVTRATAAIKITTTLWETITKVYSLDWEGRGSISANVYDKWCSATVKNDNKNNVREKIEHLFLGIHLLADSLPVCWKVSCLFWRRDAIISYRYTHKQVCFVLTSQS